MHPRQALQHQHGVNLCLLGKRVIRFHSLRHPMEMGLDEIRTFTFLSYPNNERQIAGATYSQAKSFFEHSNRCNLLWILRLE